MGDQPEVIDAPEVGDSNPPVVDSNTQVPAKSSEEKSIGSVRFYKEQLESERKEREKLAKELELSKTERLKQQNQYKELYESERVKREEAEIKVRTISESVVENLMSKEIEKEAIRKGVLPEAMNDFMQLFDKGLVEVETTSSGRINFHNVQAAIDANLATRPYFQSNRKTPIINGTYPANQPKDKILSANDLLALEKKDKAEYTRQINARLAKGI